MSTDSPLTFRVAQQPGSPDKPSEDRVFLTPNASIVLDGASQWTPLERSGGWIAEETGKRLQQGLLEDPDCNLIGLLDRTVDDVIATHSLKQGTSPSTTVNIVRATGSYLDVLVLCDGPVIILDTTGQVHELRDDRLALATQKLDRPTGFATGQRTRWEKYIRDFEALRNCQDGFWCVSATPGVGQYAVTARYSLSQVRTALAVTDGVSIGVDRYAQPATWAESFAIALQDPNLLLETVKSAEDDDPDRSRWTRSKVHDDKTIVLVEVSSS